VGLDFYIESRDLVRTKQIAEGAFGVVYRGTWKDREVAIKEAKGTGEDALRQLMDEGKKLVELPPYEHVTTFYGVCDDPVAIVLQFCNGGSLVDRLYGEKADDALPLTPLELQNVVIDVAKGLTHLHRARVIHRDVAARNVLLHDGMAKLTDMGMSRTNLGDDTGTGANYLQITATTMGPLKWMAPEQLESQAVSYKADVYSFGILMTEMWAQEEPWSNLTSVQAALAVMRGQQHPIPTSAPVPVVAAMVACLDADPHKRPPSSQLVAALTLKLTKRQEALPPLGGDGDPRVDPAVLAAVARYFSKAARKASRAKQRGGTYHRPSPV
jgi:serine/threonine protein kinase